MSREKKIYNKVDIEKNALFQINIKILHVMASNF